MTCPISKGTALIIDDDERWRSRIARGLKKFGFTCTEAQDYDTAIQALDTQEFEIVTIDMQLDTDDELSGEMVLEYITDNYPATACIMISGSVKSFAKFYDLEDEYGLRAVIQKRDFSHSELDRAVQRAKNAVQQMLQSRAVIPDTSESVAPESDLIGKNEGKEIFISYAWGGESEKIVDQLDKIFQTRGIAVVRDKRDLGFKGRITEFMEKIGRGKYVIVVVSNKYLRSPNCMFELVQVAKNRNVYDRIFPIVLHDAKIDDPIDRVEYIAYWERKIKKLDTAMKTVSAANLQGFREEMDSYTEIRNTISELIYILKDMNTLTPGMHSQSGFAELFKAIKDKLNE